MLLTAYNSAIGKLLLLLVVPHQQSVTEAMYGR